MKPISFPQANVIFKGNDYKSASVTEVIDLPAYKNEEETISLFQLTWRERLAILFRGRVWVRVLNFGRPMQPIALSLEKTLWPTEPK